MSEEQEIKCCKCDDELITDNEIYYGICEDCRDNAADLETLMECIDE